MGSAQASAHEGSNRSITSLGAGLDKALSSQDSAEAEAKKLFGAENFAAEWMSHRAVKVGAF